MCQFLAQLNIVKCSETGEALDSCLAYIVQLLLKRCITTVSTYDDTWLKHLSCLPQTFNMAAEVSMVQFLVKLDIVKCSEKGETLAACLA